MRGMYIYYELDWSKRGMLITVTKNIYHNKEKTILIAEPKIFSEHFTEIHCLNHRNVLINQNVRHTNDTPAQ